MESRVKILAIIAALCALLATGLGYAQEDASRAGRDVPQANGGADNGAASKEHVIPGSSDGSRSGATSRRAGDGREGAVVTNSWTDPVRVEGGAAGLQRRAKLKALIANLPRMATGSRPSTTHIVPPLVRPGAEAGATHNAIGIALPGSSQGLGHAAPPSTAAAAVGAHSLGSSVVGVGTPVGTISSTDAHRAAIPSNQVTSLLAHTSGINGTTIGHIASGPSYIGGPAKDRSGINGTAMRPRH
jgi:hypothetical protein